MNDSFSLSEFNESAITGESEMGDHRGHDFTAEHLLHYLDVRHTRSTSKEYQPLSAKDEQLQIKNSRIFFFTHFMVSSYDFKCMF